MFTISVQIKDGSVFEGEESGGHRRAQNVLRTICDEISVAINEGNAVYVDIGDDVRVLASEVVAAWIEIK